MGFDIGVDPSHAAHPGATAPRTPMVDGLRYDARPIASPTQTRRAIAYVLNNWRRHREDWRSAAARHAPVDPYSSGPRFGGWRDLTPTDALASLPSTYEPLPTASPTVWLLTTGWVRTKCGSCVRATGQDGWFDPFVCRWCDRADRSSSVAATSRSGQQPS
jgi:hypothetical protein